MAFRPSTQRNYNSMFRLFIAFTVLPLILIAYLQFLYTNKYSATAMANHLSAVKTKLPLLGFSTQPFEDPRIKYFQKALILHRSFKALLKKIIDIDTLQLIVRACDSTYMGRYSKQYIHWLFSHFLGYQIWSLTQEKHIPHYNIYPEPMYFLQHLEFTYS